MSSESDVGYASLRETKRRLNQSDTQTGPNQKIADNMREADNYTNVQIDLHAETPISNPDPELVSMASSLAAAFYNYWQTPVKDRNLSGIKEWKQAIQDHILAAYGKLNPSRLGGGNLFGTTKGFARNAGT